MVNTEQEYVSIGYLDEEKMYCLTLNRHYAIIMRHIDRAVVQHTVDQINADYHALQQTNKQLQEQVRELETQVTTLTIVYIDKLTEIQKECEQLRKQVIMLKENN